MYLEEAQIAGLLATLRRRLPRHDLVCDLMSRKFFRRYSQRLHREFEQLGTSFRYVTDHPEAPFLEAGYQPMERQSVVHRAAELKAIPFPPLLVRLALRTLRQGYSVYRFDSGQKR